MTAQSPARQDHIDCAHGLMIMHVMLFHLCDSSIYGTPYFYPILHTLSFFMAWFFFKSGMFYKDRKIKDVIVSGLRKLVVPALLFSAIGFIYYLISVHPETSLSNEIGYIYVFGSVHGATPMWFLFSLFAVLVLFTLLRKCKIQPIIIVIIAIALYFSNKAIGFRPYWAYNIPLGLVFFALGNLLKEIQYRKGTIIICMIVYFGLFSFILILTFNTLDSSQLLLLFHGH